jgi:multidrug efflux pump subunit AcrA (membrane-fusion protein)
MQDTTAWQDVSAEIATVDQAQVMARIPGILSTLTVKAGDTVAKGQAIGRIVDSQLGSRPAPMARRQPPRRRRRRRRRRTSSA